MRLFSLLRGKLAFLVVLSHLLNFIATQQPICCFPKQFESNTYVVNTGKQDSGGLGLVNGTVKTAYDSLNKRTYYLSKYDTKTSDDPGFSKLNSTVFVDYQKRVFYQVFLDLFCQQGDEDSDFLLECIPKNATMVGEGTLGDTSTKLHTYLTTFTMKPLDYQIVVTVIHTDKSKGECIPVQYSVTSYPIDDEAFIVASDIYDVTKGIRDESVFTPPPACNKSDNLFPGQRMKTGLHPNF